MNRLLILILLLYTSVSNNLRAGELPEVVSIKEKVRMSTLIVVGKVANSWIFDTRTLKTVNGKEIGANQRGGMQIKIERVLYASPNEIPFYSPTRHGEMVEADFGSIGLDIERPEDTLQIFFLTRDADRTSATRANHYPFYDYTNLSVPFSEEAEVTRIIAAFNEIK